MLQPNIVLTREFIQFEDLLKTTFKDRLSFNAGETILSTADDRDKYCYYVMSGLVRCEFVGYTGSLRTTTMRGEGTIFPLYYTHKVTSMEKVLEFLAETPCSLIKIKKEDLRELMIEVPAMWLAMMDAWGEYATYQPR